jgi:hypothetical protein
MIETPRTINTWALNTFGPTTTVQVATRMLCEASELLRAIDKGDSGKDQQQEECADVGVMLLQLAERTGSVSADVIRDGEAPGLRVVFKCSYWGEFLYPGLLRGKTYKLLQELSQITAEAACSVEPLLRSVSLAEKVRQALATLWGLAFWLGIEHLSERIDSKMAINRKRIWVKLPSGIWQHKESTP